MTQVEQGNERPAVARSSSERNRVAGTRKIHLFQSQERKREKQNFLSPSIKDLHYVKLRRRSSQLTVYGQSRWMGFFLLLLLLLPLLLLPLTATEECTQIYQFKQPTDFFFLCFFLFLKHENFPSIKRPNKLTTAASAYQSPPTELQLSHHDCFTFSFKKKKKRIYSSRLSIWPSAPACCCLARTLAALTR